jgi:hypothetical protein
MLLLGIWLILWGAMGFGLTFARMSDLVAGLAIVTGVLIVLDR